MCIVSDIHLNLGYLLPRHGLLANSGLPEFAALQLPQVARRAKSGHQRFSVGQKRSGRADGSWWLGYFGWEEAESVICYSSKNRGGWSRVRKWWKCFFRRCSGSPYQQSQQVRITLALISKSSWWNVIRILWHARFWTRNEKKLKKMSTSNKFRIFPDILYRMQ